MSTADNNVNVTTTEGGADFITHYQNVGAGPTGHVQIVGLGYEKTAGTTWSYATETDGFPVRIPVASNIGNKISDVWGCIGTAGGGSAFNVDIVSSAGLTVNAILENLIIGITTDVVRANIGVYGTGGTAVGVTGSVYVLGVADIESTSGIKVHGSGGGAVNVDGLVGITTALAYAQIGVYGTGGTAVGVTGTVLTDSTSLIGISGGVVVTSITNEIPIMQPVGITNGAIVSGLDVGQTLASHGLSSGVRIQAFATGSTTEYVYVGASASTVAYTGVGGLTHIGFPLREMDTVFIEIDDTGKIAVVSDNSAAKIRYIGS